MVRVPKKHARRERGARRSSGGMVGKDWGVTQRLAISWRHRRGAKKAWLVGISKGIEHKERTKWRIVQTLLLTSAGKKKRRRYQKSARGHEVLRNRQLRGGGGIG